MKIATGMKTKQDKSSKSIPEILTLLGISEDILVNVVFSESETTILKKEKASTLRYHDIEGSFETYLFSLIFETKETKDQNGMKSLEVTAMKINVEMYIFEDLKDTFQKLVDTFDVPGFFMLMSTYSSWRSSIENMFAAFNRKYPATVTYDILESTKPVLKIDGDVKSECVFIIWNKWIVDEYYHTNPEFKLCVKVTEVAFDKDKMSCLVKAPKLFSKLLSKCSLEQSISTMIKAVTAESNA